MNQQTHDPKNTNRDELSASSARSTDSLVSTNTNTSTINPLLRENPPPKDYSAALSILQSRYGTGGHVIPTPKSKPSDKLQDGVRTGGSTSDGNSQLTLFSIPSSSAGSSSRTNTSDITQSRNEKRKIGGIRSLFKGKGNDKKK